jgi:hypothetical protein
MRYQPIGNQHPMTAKIDSLGAHAGCIRLLGKLNESSHSLLKFSAQHVVGVVSKARAAQGHIWGVFQGFPPASSQFFHPDVPDLGLGQSLFEGSAIEMWKPSRHWDGTNIHQGLNGVCLKGFDEFVK